MWWFEREWPEEVHRFEHMVTREWNHLKGLGSVTVLEKTCRCKWVLRFSKLQVRPSGFLSLQPANQEVEPSATSLAPAHHHGMNQPSETVSEL